jgi:hypothetical protein
VIKSGRPSRPLGLQILLELKFHAGVCVAIGADHAQLLIAADLSVGRDKLTDSTRCDSFAFAIDQARR